jgi:hypothetical protein
VVWFNHAPMFMAITEAFGLTPAMPPIDGQPIALLIPYNASQITTLNLSKSERRAARAQPSATQINF